MEIILLGLKLLALLHIAFILVVAITKRYEKLPTWARLALGVFVFADWLMNVTYISLVTLELPKSKYELVTARFIRYNLELADSSTLINKWRYLFMYVNCRILSLSDPGHCGRLL